MERTAFMIGCTIMKAVFFRVFSVFLLFQILLELLFVYPVQARFQNTVWNTSVFVPVAHRCPKVVRI